MKRQSIPLTVKLAASLMALGFSEAQSLRAAGIGRLGAANEPRDPIQWHHDPPLGLRPMNEAGTDYDPPANDPRHIVPLSKSAHAIKTDGTHVPLSGDKSKIAKVKRLAPAVTRIVKEGERLTQAEFTRSFMGDDGELYLPPPKSKQKRVWAKRRFPNPPFVRYVQKSKPRKARP